MKDDTISRQAALKGLEDLNIASFYELNEHSKETYTEVKAMLKALPSAQPDHIGEVTEMVGDAISRQGVLRLLNAVPSEEFATKAMLISGVNALPSAQPVNIAKLQPNCNQVASDCISREAAIETVRKAKSIGQAHRMLVQLPSAQPEIIRCRNCKFASGDSRICMKFGHSPIGELDFCAWAERRTDEQV